jgi:hypothetical protein
MVLGLLTTAPEIIESSLGIEMGGRARVPNHHETVVNHFEAVTFQIATTFAHEFRYENNLAKLMIFRTCRECAAGIQTIALVSITILAAGGAQQFIFIAVVMQVSLARLFVDTRALDQVADLVVVLL